MRKLRRLIALYKVLREWDSLEALPWYTYPAIEFLSQLDLLDKTVFEYGSGSSTKWWAVRSKKLVSIEDERMWWEKIDEGLPGNVTHRLVWNGYVGTINDYPKFDIIIIDGSHRYKCAEQAISRLHHNGFIILDNSDWFPRTAEFLRKAGLLEVNMTGFGPINGYAWTTSFYFKRTASFKRVYRAVVGGFPYTERERGVTL